MFCILLVANVMILYCPNKAFLNMNQSIHIEYEKFKSYSYTN